MAPSASFRRAHPRGKNCGENTENTGRLLLPPPYYPWTRPTTLRDGRGLQLIDLCREKCDNEVPAAAQLGGGRIEQGHSGKERPFPALILFFTCLFSSALSSQRSFHTLLFAGLQVKGVTLYLLNDVFLLHLALEAAEGIL